MKTKNPPKVKSLAVEVLPPAKSNTVLLLKDDEIARQIIADHETCERSSKVAAFAALRNGIRLAWVRDNGEHGDIAKFMKTHLPSVTKQSCYRYIRIADAFLDEAGMKDKKTFKLTSGEKVEPLLSTQLELFTGSGANLESAVKRMIKWVNDRGLTQIYRDLSNEEPTHQLKGGARVKKKSDREQAHEDALFDYDAIVQMRARKPWLALQSDELALWVTELDGLNKDTAEFCKAVKAKGKGAKP